MPDEKGIKLEEIFGCGHTVRSLQKAGIETLDQLKELTDEDLLKIRGIGKVIVGDIRKRLQEMEGD